MVQAEDGIRDVAVTGVQTCAPSRRRHTRCSRDWSSDVCSSDLCLPKGNKAITRNRLVSGNGKHAVTIYINNGLSGALVIGVSHMVPLPNSKADRKSVV